MANIKGAPIKYKAGFKFHNLTILEKLGVGAPYKCQCDCGTIIYCNRMYKKSCDLCRTKRNKSFEDITGKVFNRLTVIGYAGETRGGKSHRWNCRCQCGKEVVVSRSHLYGNTKSCGCLKTETSRSCDKEKEETLIHRIWKTYLANARRKNLDFLLSKADFSRLILWPCHYCGDLPSREFFRKDQFGYRSIFVNGVDRLDNMKGYTKENSVSCCVVCNRGKSTMDLSEWLTYLQRIAENFDKKLF